MPYLVAIALALVLAGCSNATEPPPVAVVADTFCLAAKKRTWSVDDTPQTIREAVQINEGIDRACGPRSRRPKPGPEPARTS